MELLGENFTPVHGAIGGLLIGLAVAIVLIGNGRLAGISGVLEGAINPSKGGYNWRLMFLIAMPVGAYLAARFAPELATQDISLTPNVITLAIAGLLVGFGTRLGSGCTSGHGLCGIPRLSVRSILATIIFFGVAAITVYIIRHTPGITGLMDMVTGMIASVTPEAPATTLAQATPK